MKKNKKTMFEMNEMYKDCPTRTTEYEIDGRKYRVTAHYVGNKDINEVMYKYAVKRAFKEVTGMDWIGDVPYPPDKE